MGYAKTSVRLAYQVCLSHILISSSNCTNVTLFLREAVNDHSSGVVGIVTMLKPSLRTLVNIDIEYSILDGYGAPLGGLCHELEKMAGHNVVETIKLMIWVNPGFDCTRWSELDDVLMGSPKSWPELREVSLLFRVFEVYRIKALQELPMTKLVESKRVKFELEVTLF